MKREVRDGLVLLFLGGAGIAIGIWIYVAARQSAPIGEPGGRLISTPVVPSSLHHRRGIRFVREGEQSTMMWGDQYAYSFGSIGAVLVLVGATTLYKKS